MNHRNRNMPVQYLWLLLVAVLLIVVRGLPHALSEDVSAKDISPEEETPHTKTGVENGPVAVDDELDVGKWGIHNGCISTRSIRNINFHSDQTALITMNGGKKIMLEFRDRCPGIRNNGFVYQTSTGRLCAGFDRVRVIDSGWSCTIASFQPYPELVDESQP